MHCTSLVCFVNLLWFPNKSPNGSNLTLGVAEEQKAALKRGSKAAPSVTPTALDNQADIEKNKKSVEDLFCFVYGTITIQCFLCKQSVLCVYSLIFMQLG